MSWKLTRDTNELVLPDPAADYETWTEKSQALGWTAETSFDELVRMMVDADLRAV